MKSVQFDRFGPPEETLYIADVPVPDPGDDEVLVRLTARSVNPSDLYTVMGVYGVRPPLPATPGNEGAGLIAVVGKHVTRFKPDDRVTLLLGAAGASGTWHEYVVVNQKWVIQTPGNLSDAQAASAWANYLSAWVMVSDVLPISAGDTLLMTAAGSHLGRAMFQIAAHKGFEIIAVVRRQTQVEEMLALGAKAAISTDVDDLAARVRELTGGKGVRYAIDAVGGKTGTACFQALATRGRLVVYGLLSMQPMQIDGRIIFTEASVEGFWLSRWLRKAPREQVAAIYAELSQLFAEGKFTSPVDKTFNLLDVIEAVKYMDQPGRRGKVVLTGP